MTRNIKNVGGGLLGDSGLPGLFVTYELSPMMVKYTEKNRYRKYLFILYNTTVPQIIIYVQMQLQ